MGSNKWQANIETFCFTDYRFVSYVAVIYTNISSKITYG